MRGLATFHVGLSMRFPRALAIRDDLDISDCLTASGMSTNLPTAYLSHRNQLSSTAFVRTVNAKCPPNLPSMVRSPIDDSSLTYLFRQVKKRKVNKAKKVPLFAR